MSNDEFLIYLVDDDEIFHLYIDLCLSDYRSSCLHFYSGKEFIEYIVEAKNRNQNKKQILFTDIQMPGMNGLEVLSFLKKNGFDSIHKNIISAENKKLINPLLLEGVDHFFTKPITAEQISKYINKKITQSYFKSIPK